MRTIIVSILLAGLFSLTAFGKVKLPAVIGNNMVLQQKASVALWGTGKPAATVIITTGWNNKKYTVTADDAGNWRTRVSTPAAGGPYTMTFKDDDGDGEAITLNNILIGEVWVCSGQSNMEMPLKGYKNQKVKDADSLIADADKHPDIRVFQVPKIASNVPLADCSGSWKVNSSALAPQVSAVAYQYGKILSEKLHVPVGIIITCWGGTTIEAWMDEESLRPFPGIYIPAAADPLTSPEFDHPHAATLLFNSMIHPIAGYGIRGFIWYQGESNRYDPVFYQEAMPAMVKRWREIWKSGDLPFYYVQIAPYGYAGRSNYYSALLRESQLKAMNRISNCGMAVLMDAGKKTRIHPPDKTIVSQRLSYWALAKTYHQRQVHYAGPVLKRVKIRGDQACLYFGNAKQGLVAPDGKLACFEVAGDDHVFYPATAVIRDKNQVVVQSDQVKKPLSVRYAFKNWVQGDLYNKDGLPASSFRTDTWDPKPNVVLIYADDLGYGDISSYGATHLHTPNIDRIAKNGIRFTNAHASSATCTPSRYSILTGQYAWRKPGTGIAPGDAPLLIDTGRKTLPRMLQMAGYQTAAVGKWHLGLGDRSGTPNWNGTIRPGPLELGFNYSFIIPATLDRVPTVFVEDHHVVNLDVNDPIRVSYKKKVGDEPTGREHPELLKMTPSHGHDGTIINGISRIGFMSGGRSARWVDEHVADTITRKAQDFIVKNWAKPFFLYFASGDPHVPRAPNRRFVGKSGLGPRGDAILQLDWSAGEILKALDSMELTENTIIIFTSDNGPVLDDGYRDSALEKLNGHTPAGVLRGGKYSIFDAGTRVPFIVSWYGRTKAGTVSDALISQVDLFRSLAGLTGQKLVEDDAPDSYDMMSALLGKTGKGRATLVEHAGTLGLIEGDWKYIEPGDGPAIDKYVNIELGNDREPQLYNLKKDIRERNNLAKKFPKRAQRMARQLKEIRDRAS